MKAFVAQHLRYPAEAAAAGISGTVRLKITINSKGKVTDAKVIMSVGYGCDEEAVRVALLMPFDVPPNRKMRVTFYHNINIHFLHQSQPTAPAPEVPAPAQVQYHYTVTTTTTPPAAANSSTPPETGSGSSYSYTISIHPGLPE